MSDNNEYVRTAAHFWGIYGWLLPLTVIIILFLTF